MPNCQIAKVGGFLSINALGPGLGRNNAGAGSSLDYHSIEPSNLDSRLFSWVEKNAWTRIDKEQEGSVAPLATVVVGELTYCLFFSARTQDVGKGVLSSITLEDHPVGGTRIRCVCWCVGDGKDY
jgi:hypothetical protein